MPSPIEAGRAFMRLYIDDKAFRRGLDNSARRLKSFGAAAVRMGGQFAALGGAVLAPLAGAVKVFQSTGDALDKMAARTGVSVEALSELGFAAEQSGKDVAVIEKAFIGQARSIRALERGLSTAVESYEAIGLSIDDLAGKKPEEQFALIAKRLDEIEDPTKKAGVALEIFGRAGSQLIPLLGSIDALREQARELGLTIDKDTASAAAQFTDAMNELRRVLLRTAVAVGAALGSPLTKGLRAVRDVAKASIEWAKANGPLIRTVALIGIATLAAGGGIAAFGVAAIVAGAAIAGLSTVVGAVGTAFAAIVSPIGIAVAAVVGIGVAIVKYTSAGAAAVEFLRDKFGFLARIAAETFGAISDALASGDLQLAAKALMAGLQATFLEGKAKLLAVWTPIATSLVDVWSKATSGITNTMASLQSTWANVVSGMRKTWAFFSEGVTVGWATAQNFVTTGVLQLQKKINEAFTGQEFDISVELDQADKKLRKTQQNIANETQTQIAAAEASRQESLANIEAGRQAALAEITDAEAVRREKIASQLAEAQQAATDARKELEGVAKQAKAGKEAADGGDQKSIAERIKDAADVALDGLTGSVEKVAAAGTFSGRAAAATLTNSADREAQQERKKQTKVLDKIAKNTKFGGVIPIGA